MAATQAEIFISAPDGLLTGIEFMDLGGTFHQATVVNGNDLQADLTIQLPAARTAAEPGPVVVFWQLRVDVGDVEFGDISHRIIGPPQVQVLLPDCDESGQCVVHPRVSGPVGPAVEANALDWVLQTRLTLALTLVRTFDNGSYLQAISIAGALDGDGGTISSPSDTDGRLISAAVVPADEAQPGILPSEQFQGGRQDDYDWGSATLEALADLPVVPEPGPIDVGSGLPVPTVLLLAMAVVGGVLFFALRLSRSKSASNS